MGAREDHHGTRQRYTIMTSVHSWHDRDMPEPPGVAVLFKGDGDRALGLVAPPPAYVRTYACAGHIRTYVAVTEPTYLCACAPLTGFFTGVAMGACD